MIMIEKKAFCYRREVNTRYLVKRQNEISNLNNRLANIKT